MTATPSVPPRLPRWAVSVLAVLAAAGLGWLLAPWVGAESAYLLFTVAVMISARYGGLWSGLAATVLGGALVLGVLVTAPASPAQWLLLVVFLAVGAVPVLPHEGPGRRRRRRPGPRARSSAAGDRSRRRADAARASSSRTRSACARRGASRTPSWPPSPTSCALR